MVRAREATTVRSWNVESWAHVADDLASIVDEWQRPAIVCLQEVRVRALDEPLIGAMAASLPGYCCHASLANDPFNVRFRGGCGNGVASFVREDVEAVERRLAWNVEGRVIISELPALRLAIVNVYAVNGTDRPYFDPASGQAAGDRHGWKRRFNQLVFNEIAALQTRALEVVAIGDWNISPAVLDAHPRLRTEEPHAAARRQLVGELMPAARMVDVFRALHPSARKYTWRNRRSRYLDAARVDYALVSAALMPRVVAADIEDDPRYHAHSDHLPLWLTVAT